MYYKYIILEEVALNASLYNAPIIFCDIRCIPLLGGIHHAQLLNVTSSLTVSYSGPNPKLGVHDALLAVQNLSSTYFSVM